MASDSTVRDPVRTRGPERGPERDPKQSSFLLLKRGEAMGVRLPASIYLTPCL